MDEGDDDAGRCSLGASMNWFFSLMRCRLLIGDRALDNSPHQPCTTTIGDLPDECLVEIIRRVGGSSASLPRPRWMRPRNDATWPVHHPLQCALVCKRWHTLTDTAILSLNFLASHFNGSLPPYLGRRFHHLVSLTLDAAGPTPMLDLTIALAALPSLPHLRHLAIISSGASRSPQLCLTPTVLSQLTSLRLDFPCVPSISPSALPFAGVLCELVLRNFEGSELPPHVLGILSGLTKLEFNDCKQLATVPPDLARLENLHVLAVRTCPLLSTWLPAESLSGRHALHTLVVNRCRSIPRAIGHFRSLETLSLYGFRNLPDGLTDLVKLRKLELFNGISVSELPETLSHLCRLESLRLCFFSSLSHIPEALSTLTTLRHLEMTKCGNKRLESLPESLGRLTRLRTCKISGLSRLALLPAGVCEWHVLTRLEVIHCTWLRELPRDIGRLTALREMRIEGCHSLDSLPEGIREWRMLTRMEIFWCDGMTEIPEGLGGLSELRELQISTCSALVSLPRSLGSLGSLRRLQVVSCGSLTKLPDTLEGLTSLKELKVRDCRALSGPLPKGLLQRSGLRIERS